MRRGAIFCTLILLAFPALAGELVTVAVASNFSRTAGELSARFAGETGITVRISNGSTGKLYAQILNGAPFDVFLAADARRPALLEQAGRTVPGSRFTYAVGALVLWSRDAEDCLAALHDEDAGRVALANPEFLKREGLWGSVSKRAVFGENIGQAMQFVATRNAPLGLIARSQLSVPQLPDAACTWDVPSDYYSGLDQQAVLLARAAGNESAARFYDWLRSADAREVIAQHGYEVAP